MEGREGVWENGTYGSGGFAGGQLVVKIRKVEITGRGEGRREGSIAVVMSVMFIPTWVMSEARCSSRQSAAASSDSVEE